MTTDPTQSQPVAATNPAHRFPQTPLSEAALRQLLAEAREHDQRATPAPWYAHNTDDSANMRIQQVIALTLLQSPRVVDHESRLWEENNSAIAFFRTHGPKFAAALEVALAGLEGIAKDEFNAFAFEESRETLQKIHAICAGPPTE